MSKGRSCGFTYYPSSQVSKDWQSLDVILTRKFLASVQCHITKKQSYLPSTIGIGLNWLGLNPQQIKRWVHSLPLKFSLLILPISVSIMFWWDFTWIYKQWHNNCYPMKLLVWFMFALIQAQYLMFLPWPFDIPIKFETKKQLSWLHKSYHDGMNFNA